MTMKNSGLIGNLRLYLGTAVALFAPATAFGWGQYGHQQVNNAAIDLLGTSNGLGRCFDQGRYVVKRLAITPDMEWKTDLFIPTLSPDDKEKRLDDNKYEHPLHFDEVDAWVPNPKPGQIAQLPAGEFADVFSFYRDKLRENATYVAKIDPSKKLKNPESPSVDEVTDHGTAPWRALQLYRLGVDALKRKDVKAAMLYLGTMGHYVGDMSQPFHASLDFDGDYYPTPAAGIHHEIDTGTLPNKGKDSSSVYPSFDTTSGPVMAAGQALLRDGVEGLRESQIVGEIFKMIDAGYPDVATFLKSYSQECAAAQSGKAAGDFSTACSNDDQKHCSAEADKEAPTPRRVQRTQKRAKAPTPTSGNGGHGHEPTAGTGDYCVAPGADAGPHAEVRPLPAENERDFGSQVVPEMEKRLGASAALLARIWASAYEAAGKPELTGCNNATFDQSYVIQNYPRPNDSSQHGYMPDGYAAQGGGN